MKPARRQRCHICGYIVPITPTGLQRMADHFTNLECRPTFNNSGTCRHRWQEADTLSRPDVEADDTHRCTLPDTHPGQHVCYCGYETGQ